MDWVRSVGRVGVGVGVGFAGGSSEGIITKESWRTWAYFIMLISPRTQGGLDRLSTTVVSWVMTRHIQN